jgi:hypothetical protein
MARINGRIVRASNLAERRVLHQIGVDSLRVPRGQNPYLVARRLKRAAKPDPDLMFLAAVAKRRNPAGTPSAQGAPVAIEQVSSLPVLPSQPVTAAA